jgi:tRNA 2-thiocytidine biosynthesis protein TtcA
MSKIEKKLFHYLSRAAHDFDLIQKGDRVMACLSGGKDSFTMVNLLAQLRVEANYSFELFVFTLDQAQPGWDDTQLRHWLDAHKLPYEILRRDTYSIVKEKIPAGKTYCSLCSRLRRGNIYNYAETHGFNKIALGHHRDDLITTLLMSILYSGQIKSMPPKLLSDNGKNIVIRPLVYCQESDIIEYAAEQKFPIIPCTLCGSQENLVRKQVKNLIENLAKTNPKIPSNILHALQHIEPAHLMDKRWWDFKAMQQSENLAATDIKTKVFDDCENNPLMVK